MKSCLLLIFILFSSLVSIGQDRSKQNVEQVKHERVPTTTYEPPTFFYGDEMFNRKRFISTSIGIGATWAGGMIGLNQVWYSQISKSPWNSFDDSKNWLQMDKVGHFYTAYKINALTTDLYDWGGAYRASKWIGFGVSLGFQTTLEFFDAYTEEWGWSWSDMAANTLGSVGYLVQRLVWDEQRIIPKFSYSPTEFAAIRPNVLVSTFA